MRKFLLSLLTFALAVLAPVQSAEPFEIKDGDRVLFLGDTLLEREGTYGCLETRMAEQFPDRKFTVRNLAFSADTPLGWSRASFDPPAKGFERLKEQLALVKPTVVFLGYGMAASLQEMTDRSQDWTLNRDPARYGAEPMSAARFKKELAQCMDAIESTAKEQSSDAVETAKQRSSEDGKTSSPASPSPLRSFAVNKSPVRFVLLSPIRHEDLRATRPGLPDPTEHNKLLEQYSKAIEELAKERGARFVDLSNTGNGVSSGTRHEKANPTDNGIHLNADGYRFAKDDLASTLGWGATAWRVEFEERKKKARDAANTNTLEGTIKWAQELGAAGKEYFVKYHALRNAIIRKNALFFHRWRPANETYLFGFRKREQGQNAVEIPQFDPLIEAAEAEIERLKRADAGKESGVRDQESGKTEHKELGIRDQGSRKTPDPNLTPDSRPLTPSAAKLAASPSTLPLPTFTLADGLEISLWAENPLLAKPTEMNWDAQGRLWIASSALYPMIAPGQAASDKIIILEDPGHTGKATKSTVFVDGLLIPTGVAPVLVDAGEGSGVRSQESGKTSAPNLTPDSRPLTPSAARWACYVGQSTELLYFEDTLGTGKADKKRIVLSGFGTEDTHHIVHTLRWGPDGRLYFSQSVYIHTHMETPWGVVRVNSGGVFAYDPRTERVEVVTKGLWNTWGHAWDKWGQSFYTDGAGSTGLSWGFPGATFAPNEGARRTMASISPGSYPKFAGLELIYSPHFPAEWQGSAVTCDFRAHKIVHFKINDLSAEGKSGYVTDQLPVLVQTSDATFRPIDVKLGPDGAIYIADWSNPIINHGEVDFRDPRRDHEHGRIWRLSMKGGAAVKWSDLNKLSGKELIKQVESGSLWAVSNARQILASFIGRTAVSEKDSQRINEVFDDLGPWWQGSSDLKEPARSQVNLEHFWIAKNNTLEWASYVYGFGSSHIAVPQARAIAARYLEGMQGANKGVKASLVVDPSPRVRIEAMRTLARARWSLNTFDADAAVENASLILDAAIHAPKDDPQYEFAAWLSINDLAEVWTKAVLAGEWKPEGREKQFEFALNAIEPALAGQVLSQFVSTGRAPLDGSGPWIELIGNTGGPGELRPLLDALLAATKPDGDNMKPLADAKFKFKTPDANRRAAAALVAAARRGVKPAGELAPWQFYMYAPADALPDVFRLAGLWKQEVSNAIIGRIAGNKSAPAIDAAFEALRTLGTPKAADFLTAFLDPAQAKKLDSEFLNSALENSDAGKRRRALVALAPLRPNEAMKYLGTVLKETGEPGHLQLWRDLFASPPFVQRFSQATPKDLPPAAYASAMRAAREMGRKGEGLANKLAPLAGESTVQVAPADYNDLAARAKKDGDPVAGEALYRRTASACTTCHAIGGAGGKLGPDMTSIGASAPPDYIIESILNPAAKVKEGYHAFSFTMKDGSEAIGIPTRETPQEQFIRTLAGEQGLPKANIVSKKIAEGGASLMPAGLAAAWTDRERLNLYAFLMELGRPGSFDASKNNVARVWMLTDSGPTDGALKGEAAASITSIPAYTLVDGRLTKDLLAEKLAMLAPKNATVHLTTRFQAASTGKAKLNLTGIRKAWLDGQPLAIASEPSPSVELTAGAHAFTVEVDAKSPPEVLRLESPAANFLGD